jgi:DNA-binding response OmpR family regulator
MITTQMLLENTRDLNVLYVEDDKALSDTTEELLSMYFKSVRVAYDGEEGYNRYIQYEQENNAYYDLVIADINMPKLSGIEMSKKIYKINELQSIVLITAHNNSDYLFEAICIGVSGFVLKPIQTEQLFQALYRAVQSICNQKMIEDYLKQVEDLNIELEEKNSSLEFKNSELEKSLRMLDTVINRDEIIISKQKIIEDESEEAIQNREDIKEQIVQLISDDLFELKDVLTDIDVEIIAIINNIDVLSTIDLDNLIKGFSRYAAILNYYTFFSDLSLAMQKFAKIMQNTPLPEDKEIVNNVFIFLETFIYVLSKWHNDLSSGDENKLNQFDSSIISDMETIINMWTLKYEESNGVDNLDDIFDF